jgi:hypothetical protein
VPPGIGAKISRTFLENSFGISYISGTVAIECTVVDLHIGALSINGSALGVACPARTWKKNQGNSRGPQSSTYVASGVGVKD